MTGDQVRVDRLRGVAQFAIISAIVFAIALTLDGWAATHVRSDTARYEDWHRLLRIAGYLPSWVLIATIFLLIDRSDGASTPAPRPWLRGAYLLLSVLSAGLVAEALKLLLRRERPHELAEYVFRSFWDRPLSTVNLGLPSSHSLVAFAGAFALCRLVPAGCPVWVLFAAGCGLTRLLDGGHFLSDVALGAVAGYAVAWGMWRLLRLDGAGARVGPAGEQ